MFTYIDRTTIKRCGRFNGSVNKKNSHYRIDVFNKNTKSTLINAFNKMRNVQNHTNTAEKRDFFFFMRFLVIHYLLVLF